ncbi:MAG: branched chain amino acid aminotransferase, partial [Cyclobacteriaceae bacterium]|nr:branched chain amino acid aminotransferase [Cyclobacteriaceae bacterium]
MTDTISVEIKKTDASRISELDENNIPFGKLYTDHMFIADYKDGNWNNFRIMPYGDIKISPANQTLHYGVSIFEGMKAYKNTKGEPVLFRPLDNFKRMNESAVRMCMPELPEEVFMGGLSSLLNIDKEWIPSKEGTSLYVRPFMFSTEAYIGIKPSEVFSFMIICGPVGAYYNKPVSVKIETKYTRAIEGGTGAAKTAGNYAASLYPALLAQKMG